MNDFKYALRALLRSPGFTGIAVATLALGIGLNTAVFSLLNVMFLRPLPFEDESSLVRVFRTTPGNNEGDLSAADFLDIQASSSGIAEFASSWDESATLSDKGGAAEIENSLRVSPNYFDVLRLHAEIGRTFTQQDEATGSPKVAVISYNLWRTRYARSPDVLGRVVRIGGENHVIVGVLPEFANDGRLIRDFGLFRTQRLAPSERSSREDPWMRVIGRRAASVTPAQANAFVANLGARIAQGNPKTDGNSGLRSATLMGATGSQTARVIISMLLCLSAFVLLIACSNLANFILARAIERSQELSVRAALGASLYHLVRPLAVESLLLACGGGLGALLVDSWCSDWLTAQALESGGSAIHFPLDWRVLGFAVASSVMTAAVFGTAPALLIARMNVGDTLKNGMRGTTTGTRHRKMRSLLVVGQFAMAMTLLAGAAYLVRGANSLTRQHFGWDSSDVAVGQFNLPKAKYDSGDKILVFERELGTKLRAMPGVDSFSLAYCFPYSAAVGGRQFQVEGKAAPAVGAEPTAGYNGISPDYFRVSGGRILAGRAFTEADSAKAPRVSIISEGMASALFPNGDAIGQRIRRMDTEKPEWSLIVGIAANSRAASFYKQPFVFQVYHPLSQEPWGYSMFGVRAQPGTLKSVLEGLRPAIAEIDPDLAVENLMSGDAMVERSSFDLGMLKKILGTFAAIGLLLAALGIYAVIARTVVQRTSEIGIRMALGASAANVRRLILTSGIRLAVAGSAMGLLGCFAVTRLLAKMMPGLDSSAAPIIGASMGILALVALVSCYLPARAASRVNPVDAIRGD